MYEMKPISAQAIPEALAKAERYRLLNNPRQAESICLDVLSVDPDNQKAVVMLILACTDQSDSVITINGARKYLPRLASEYERAYYAGIICERLGMAHWKHATPGCGMDAYQCLREAMEFYLKAEAVRPQGNDDALLRWNACARTLMAHPEMHARPPETPRVVLDD
ncbi:MAG: hypothetical protein FJW20_13650 [Acidimicrobiia bacterium]|nr:hypothetical protein [Acidimicrobiia bacterium]